MRPGAFGERLHLPQPTFPPPTHTHSEDSVCFSAHREERRAEAERSCDARQNKCCILSRHVCFVSWDLAIHDVSVAHLLCMLAFSTFSPSRPPDEKLAMCHMFVTGYDETTSFRPLIAIINASRTATPNGQSGSGATTDAQSPVAHGGI